MSRTLADWRLLMTVAALQVATAAAARVCSLRRVRATAARMGRLIAADARADVARVVWAIEATGRRLGPLSTCLVRAVAAEGILKLPTRHLRFTIGVKRGADGALHAHAWVASEERVLIGATPDPYAPLVEWSDPSS